MTDIEFDISLPIYQTMSAKNNIIYEAKGEITLIELHSLRNCLPVSSDTYLRILHGLSMNGSVKLPGKDHSSRSEASLKKNS